jgi:Na+/H+-dicarboxylate symporter
MECVTDNLGVDEEVSSFVLPLGATVNMDGTSLYQAVAILLPKQCSRGIRSSDTVDGSDSDPSSIGSAASAGMVMLVIVLGQAGIPEAGLSLFCDR